MLVILENQFKDASSHNFNAVFITLSKTQFEKIKNYGFLVSVNYYYN